METEILPFTLKIRKIAGIQYLPHIIIDNLEKFISLTILLEVNVSIKFNTPRYQKSILEKILSSENLILSGSQNAIHKVFPLSKLPDRAIFRLFEKSIIQKSRNPFLFYELLDNFIFHDDEAILRAVHRWQKSLFESTVSEICKSDTNISSGLLKWFSEFSVDAKNRLNLQNSILKIIRENNNRENNILYLNIK